MLLNLFSGMMIGFLIAIPIGPIDMLCIRKTLVGGVRAGFVTGLGAAIADAIYGASASFGLATLTSFLISYKIIFEVLGGIFLCGIGFKTYFKKRISASEENLPEISLVSAFFTTFFLALLSPVTILSFAGAFALLGVGLEQGDFHAPALWTLGVFAGSALWWLLLSQGVALFKNRLSFKHIYWINHFSGGLLICFGCLAIGLACWDNFITLGGQDEVALRQAIDLMSP